MKGTKILLAVITDEKEILILRFRILPVVLIAGAVTAALLRFVP